MSLCNKMQMLRTAEETFGSYFVDFLEGVLVTQSVTIRGALFRNNLPDKFSEQI